jgi:molybdopterin biosynthesis enzyme
MALDKAGLVQAIQNLRNIEINTGDKENDELSEVLATAIETYVKSGDVVVSSGSSSGTYKVT